VVGRGNGGGRAWVAAAACGAARTGARGEDGSGSGGAHAGAVVYVQEQRRAGGQRPRQWRQRSVRSVGGRGGSEHTMWHGAGAGERGLDAQQASNGRTLGGRQVADGECIGGPG
jgi:hypothetical protein